MLEVKSSDGIDKVKSKVQNKVSPQKLNLQMQSTTSRSKSKKRNYYHGG
jgi:hypothetical protein